MKNFEFLHTKAQFESTPSMVKEDNWEEKNRKNGENGENGGPLT